MDIRQVSDVMHTTGERMIKLSKQLEAGGRPLKSEEKELVRMAMLPSVTESCDLIRSAFICGNTSWLETEMERLIEATKLDL